MSKNSAYLELTKQTNKMTNLTITVSGQKAGEQVFFILNVEKSNFFNVMNMTFNSVQDVLEGEKRGLYTVSK